MSTPEEHLSACLRFQEYYDNTLRKVGMRAPQPTLGQTVNDYRRETLRTIKRTFLPQNHPLYAVQMRELKADALGVLEPQVLEAAVTEANNPCHVEPGQLKKIERFDQYGQVKTIDWIGQESFVKQMPNYRPGRRVQSFRDPVDHSGNVVRWLNVP
jgi:hypothetical protein